VIFGVGFGQRQNHLVCAVYCDWDTRMATESLTDVVQSLTPQEQDAVLRFIDYLKGRDVSLALDRRFMQAAMSSSPSIRISCSASPSDPVSHGRRDSRGSRTIDLHASVGRTVSGITALWSRPWLDPAAGITVT